VLLVDDDDVTRSELVRVLEQRGFRVQSCAHGEEFLEIVAATARLESPPLLLIDLFMPRMDGSGILGGLELVELVRERYPALHVLVLSDHPHDDAEQRILKLGIPPVISKPKKSEMRAARDGDALTLVGDALSAAIEKLLHGATAPVPGPTTINFGADLLREMGEVGPETRAVKGPESPGLYLLRGMLQELNNPSLGGGIILLVLRFASELMNRAVIFLVKEHEIVGLGQFGIESKGGEVADMRVRRMKILRGEDSIFEPVLREQASRRVRLGNSQWDRYLVEQLGGGEPQEVFLGPIISEGKVVALIYGDNLPEKTPIGDTESLEIFISQAGLAMEKALLERRLRGKDAAL
jgi:CheY-like chemotaxis protein